jgi:CubicO group peptidase (beta-lactamase class C family)
VAGLVVPCSIPTAKVKKLEVVMKANRKRRFWLLGGVLILVATLGIVAYLTIPGRGRLPELPEPDYWPTDGWERVSPEARGFDSARLAQGLRNLQEKGIAIDSLLIVRDGYLVLEANFSPYDGSFPHDMASVAKSVTTTLIGIAIQQGILDLDQPVVSFFPDRSIANLDADKMNLTVRDLVSMRNGMESGCFEGDEATLEAMRLSVDWVQAALDRKMVYSPGTHFCYDSPGMHLLSAILQDAAGMTELDYARQFLFEPLGIHTVIWEADPQSYTHGWGDLHLLPQDAAKLGYLWLHKGIWAGQQIVPPSWVSESIRAHSRLVGNEYGYGYGWWVSPVDFYALGRGGQFIRVIPSLNTVLVITGGEYDIGQVESFLIKILLGARKSLPANPQGLAELDTALVMLVQAPARESLASLPDTALMVSEKEYQCAENAAGVSRVRLGFNDSDEASLSLTQDGVESVWPVGLDGKYRLSLQGQGQCGYWENSQVFVLEIFDIGQLTRRLIFDAGSLEVDIPEAELILQCHVQTP